MEKAFIIGNGESRKDFDLMILKGKGVVFGCNALYRDFQISNPKYVLPDYLVAIDDEIITEIESSDFPSSRFINPPEDEKWEPVELHWGKAVNKDWDLKRPRSNAGMNAMFEAIKMGHTDLHLLGFDALLVDKTIALSNLYKDSACYTANTAASISDCRNRIHFIGWSVEKHKDVNFNFYFPSDIIKKGVYTPQVKNFFCKDFSFLQLQFQE